MTLYSADSYDVDIVTINGGPNVAFNCMACDDEEGWADLIMMDANGKWLVDRNGYSVEPFVIRHFGRVEVKRVRQCAVLAM